MLIRVNWVQGTQGGFLHVSSRVEEMTKVFDQLLAGTQDERGMDS